LSAALDTVKRLRENNRDAPHTNFYYSFLRLWWIGNAGHFDFNSAKWRGCALNLVFFSLSYLFMVMLLKKLFGAENKGIIILGLAAAFSILERYPIRSLYDRMLYRKLFLS